MSELIEMLFGIWTRLGPRKHVLGGMHWSQLANTLNRPCVAAMRPVVKLL